MSTCETCGRSLDETGSCIRCGRTVERTVEKTVKRQVTEKVSGETASPNSRFAPGDVIAERYRIVNLLGHGGMGEVFRAEDLRLRQDVALKFLSLDARSAPEDLFEEVRIARQVTHPNVCRIYDVGDHHGLHFISMEYCPGEDLNTLLRRMGRLPPERAVEVGSEICRGLAAIHERGVLHRDLKPANVFFDAEGRIRVADFGLAAVGSVQGKAARSGTPAYMAPEQHAGLEVTVRSDLYALGLILYEIFTGERAFRAENIAELMRLHAKESPAAPSSLVKGLDPTIERMILRCLEKDPVRRPASADAVGGALFADDGFQDGTYLTTMVTRGASDSSERDESMVADLLEEYGGREAFADDGASLWIFERPWNAARFSLAYRKACTEPPALGGHLGEAALRRSPSGIEIVGDAPATALSLSDLAAPGQALWTGPAFDLARASAMAAPSAAEIRWLAHGEYVLGDTGRIVEVFEIGREGVAPLQAPDPSRRASVLDGKTVAGWRPAPGQGIPNRPNWLIERKLGSGGFGEVWLGRRLKTMERRVFKFSYDAARIRSLKHEVMLFRLLKEELGDCDGIARILDWNFEEPPYFIESEYTAGGDLSAWAEAQGGLDKVPIEIRLEIVAQAADALAAAHSVGVLHKDVKPANVLISAAGSSVRARLMDFGVGRVVDPTRLAAAGITAIARSPQTIEESSQGGTRLYTAPEVLEGEAATVQADVYALGIMLFQIVSGDFSRALALGWQRHVDDELLREDIAQAVDGDPHYRIRSATELAERLRSLEARREKRREEDEERLRLEDLARQVRRGRKRRRTALTTIAVLAMFAAGLGYQVRQTKLEAERANREAAGAREVATFIAGLFKELDPLEIGRNFEEITARQIVDRAAERLETELLERPLSRAEVLSSIGDLYRELDRTAEAESLLRESLELREAHLGPDDPLVAGSLRQLGRLLWRVSRYEEAESLFRRALRINESLYPPDHLVISDDLSSLADLLYDVDRFEEAERLLRRVLEIRQAGYGSDHPKVAASMIDLATVLQKTKRPSEAEPLHRRALEILEANYGDSHPRVALSLNNLAGLLRTTDRPSEAEPLYRRALAINEASYGEDHPIVANNLNNLAGLLQSTNRLSEAESACRRALAINQASYGENNPLVATNLNNLAVLLASMENRLPEVETLHRRALAIAEASYGANHPRVAMSLNNLGALLQKMNRFSESETDLRRALRIFEISDFDPNDPWVANAECTLARALISTGRLDEAERMVERCTPILLDRWSTNVAIQEKVAKVLKEFEAAKARTDPSGEGVGEDDQSSRSTDAGST